MFAWYNRLLRKHILFLNKFSLAHLVLTGSLLLSDRVKLKTAKHVVKHLRLVRSEQVLILNHSVARLLNFAVSFGKTLRRHLFG